MATVRLPPVLRPAAGGSKEIAAEGGTLAAVLDDLTARFPSLRSRLLDESGALQRFVNVYVDMEDVRVGDGLETPTGEATTVMIMPPMAGGALHASVEGAIGDTPLVEVSQFSAVEGVRIFAKLEGQNPLGSVKDRVARALLEDVERRGFDPTLQTLLEPTSGNTGIALAMLCSVRGWRCAFVMPDNVTEERRQMLTLFGAEIIESPGEFGSNGAVALAKELVERADGDYVMPFQYGNPANPRAHYETTAPEILRDVPGGRVDAFVAGLGTGGTLMGCGRRLREANPDVAIVAAEPLPGDPVMGLRSLEDGFVPPILDVRALDRKILVSNLESVVWTRRLAREAGIFSGTSGGAAMSVAVRHAERMQPGEHIVVLLPEGGWKTLSTGVWTAPLEAVEEEMERVLWW